MSEAPEVRRVAIVGGGITGLAAALAVVKRAQDRAQAVAVTVLERSDRFGGNLRTEKAGGFVLDAGPDSWVANKPQATALARDLGLGGELVGTDERHRRYYIAWRDRLHAVPEGLVLGVPTRLAPLAATRLFSWRGKLRMACEPLVATRRFEGDDDDESIADFAARRLGREASERLVAPLLGGISAGDASELSVRAAFPQLVAMERDHGSLVRGMRAMRKPAAGGKPPSAFVSLDRGVGGLPDALVDRLRSSGVELRPATSVTGLARHGDAWSIGIAGGAAVTADDVLLAVPAHVAAGVLAGVDDGLAGALGDIRYGSTATVFLAYRTSDLARPLDGVGFVVPRAMGRAILAGTWVSCKWRGRAPEGHSLVRAFFGGAGGEEVLARSDDDLASLARSELAALAGLTAEPLWSRVFRFDRVSAQMRVGHLAAMRAIRRRLTERAPSLYVAGGGYDGVGIPDCIRQAQEVASSIVA
jgi:protoporphyrinogen/coproporphyrinogen III oxidase